MIGDDCKLFVQNIGSEGSNAVHDSKSFTFRSTVALLSGVLSCTCVGNWMFIAIVVKLSKYTTNGVVACVRKDVEGFVEVRVSEYW